MTTRASSAVPRCLALVIAVLAADSARSARAASPPDDDARSLPCRPTIACTADIVTPGSFELETGMLFRKVEREGRQWTFPFLAKLTLARWVQLQVGSNGYTAQWDVGRASYFDNVSAGLKFHLVDHSPLVPSVSVSGAISAPTVQGLGYERINDAYLIAYVTKDFGPLHADLNLGLNAFRIEGSPATQDWVALAFSAPLPAPFGIMAEGYYYANALPIAAHDGGFLFALTHSPKPWLVFDVGGDVGYFPSTRSFSAFIGMTIIPVVLWDARK